MVEKIFSLEGYIMKYLQKIIVLVSTLCLTILAHADENSPIGYWRTIDDVTGKQKSIVKIYEVADHTLQGRVMKIFPRPGKDENEVCTECRDEKHNQRIVGMVILTGMKAADSSKWSGGKILDPLNGKYYSCIIRLVSNGQELSVRGYIGLPLIGRSQTWERVEAKQAR